MVSNGLTAKRLGRITTPFHRLAEKPSATVMIVGDSTAVGTGAPQPEQSVAGRLAGDFPSITVVNHSINGASSSDLVSLLIEHPEWRADLIIIHIGGIDIMGFRSLHTFRKNIVSILEMARQIAPRIALITTPDLGSIPYFRFPISLLISWRTRQVRDFVLHCAEKNDFAYVDLYTDAPDDPFLTQRKKYFAADNIHPSGDGYALWYALLKQALIERGWIEKLQKNDSPS